MGDYIVEQRLDANGLYLRSSRGTELTITPAMVQQLSGGTKNQKLTAIRDLLVATFGDNIDVSKRTIDYDPQTWRIIRSDYG